MKPRCLALGDPVHAGDGLQEIVLAEAFIDIHDLLDGRIEAGQQHVADDQEGDAGERFFGIVEVERFRKVFDGVPALGFFARFGYRRRAHWWDRKRRPPRL